MSADPTSPADAPEQADSVPFWRMKSLGEMTEAEWESLCDGCGRCCLVKLEDEDSGAVVYTDVGCTLLDAQSCRCADYENRQARVPDCVRLTVEAVTTLSWLPETCAYRLLGDGRDLHWWHPLVSGDPDTVHQAGISVRGHVYGLEHEVSLDEILERVTHWEGVS